MNLLGKILTLLILVMSIFFLAIALMTSAAHRNWKVAASSLQSDYQAIQQQLTATKTSTLEKEQFIQAEKVARAQQLAQLESQLAVYRNEIDSLSKQVSEETILSKERLARLEQAEARASQLDKENKGLSERNVTLSKEVATSYEKLTDFTNKTFELNTRIEQLTTLNEDISGALAKRKKVMDRMGLNENELVKDIVPLINAVVVRTQGDLFAIAAGTDDGLREGHVLDIYRGDKFVGRGVVKNVEHNLAVLGTLSAFMQANVQEGDDVTSKF
jgi:myosin heavy subunit